MSETERMELLAKLESAETDTEVAEIENAIGIDNQPTDRWAVATLGEVASFFQVHPQTCKTWRQEGLPGSEGAWHLPTIVQWRLGRAEKRHNETNEGHKALMKEKLKVEVERRKLDLAERTNQLVRRDAVAAANRELFSLIRARIEAIPGECAALVPADLRGKLMEELDVKIRSILKELARGATKNAEDA